jgi:hypothetical protein
VSWRCLWWIGQLQQDPHRRNMHTVYSRKSCSSCSVAEPGIRCSSASEGFVELRQKKNVRQFATIALRYRCLQRGQVMSLRKEQDWAPNSPALGAEIGKRSVTLGKQERSLSLPLNQTHLTQERRYVRPHDRASSTTYYKSSIHHDQRPNSTSSHNTHCSSRLIANTLPPQLTVPHALRRHFAKNHKHSKTLGQHFQDTRRIQEA